jgi:hypothetical protein
MATHAPNTAQSSLLQAKACASLVVAYRFRSVIRYWLSGLLLAVLILWALSFVVALVYVQ